MQLPRFSIGTGDRFAHQARAQLQACILARQAGLMVAPVWNKSNREHLIIGSEPAETRASADAAVRELNWSDPYFLDADHITLDTFGRYAQPCDFFTIDVADQIGKRFDVAQVSAFVERHPELLGTLLIEGVEDPFRVDKALLERTARQFLAAVQKAGEIFRAIVEARGNRDFITEISMDETSRPQTPVELLIIMAAIADEQIPIGTIAPKFTGRFNKGVDYVGDVEQFACEFSQDIAAIRYAIKQYGLPAELKLSVHSGSDKFSIYGAIHAGVRATHAGVHVKTAGTTWLEELIGLSEAGGDGLVLAKEVYREALAHMDELCAPYATVIDIRRDHLPEPAELGLWSSEQFVRALRHNEIDPLYNPDLRQLLHVGFKIAAKMGNRYTDALKANEEIIARNVTHNLYDRHLRPIFLGE